VKTYELWLTGFDAWTGKPITSATRTFTALGNKDAIYEATTAATLLRDEALDETVEGFWLRSEDNELLGVFAWCSSCSLLYAEDEQAEQREDQLCPSCMDDRREAEAEEEREALEEAQNIRDLIAESYEGERYA